MSIDESVPARPDLSPTKERKMDAMAWEWVAPVCTAAVGIAGISAALYQNRRQSATALDVAREQIKGQTAIAREERQQRRAEAAYLELLADVIATKQWAGTIIQAALSQMTQNPLEYPTRMALPNLYIDPPLSGGTLMPYWSPRVNQLIDNLRVAMRELRSGAIGFEIEHTDRGSAPEWRGQDATTVLFARQASVDRSVEAVRSHIAAELNLAHDGSASAVGGPTRDTGDSATSVQ